MSDDPYLIPNTTVLKNNFGITNQAKLDLREQQATHFRLRELQTDPVKGRFDLAHMQEIHRRIFQDVYPFAGKIRTINMSKAEEKLDGASVKYSTIMNIRPEAGWHLRDLGDRNWAGLKGMAKPDDMAEFAKSVIGAWRAHPFREGNTRTTMTFANQFAKEHGFALDTKLLGDNADFVRSALVVGSMGKTEHLTKILTDARHRQIKKEVARNDKLEARLASPEAARDPRLKGMASKLALLEAELKQGGASKEEITISRKNAIHNMAANHRAGKDYKIEKLPNSANRSDIEQDQKQKGQDRSRDR